MRREMRSAIGYIVTFVEPLPEGADEIDMDPLLEGYCERCRLNFNGTIEELVDFKRNHLCDPNRVRFGS